MTKTSPTQTAPTSAPPSLQAWVARYRPDLVKTLGGLPWRRQAHLLARWFKIDADQLEAQEPEAIAQAMRGVEGMTRH
jgi:hypothetical protein